MPCYHPLKGFRSKVVNDSGKRSIVFNRSDGFVDLPVEVPCGQCIGCRLERSRQWACRCIQEASMYDDNCFITLTFSEENFPDDGSLHVEDFQKFLKRLRKLIYPNKVRYFHCGEYGSKLQRPHHHACLFGYDFPDKELFSVRDGVRLYRSDILESLWPFGFCTIGDVTFESSAYVARYCVKKVNGSRRDEHYQGRHPEYVTMSRRPGIGHDWYKKYRNDMYPHDYMVIRGNIKCRPPRYYDNMFDKDFSQEYIGIKSKRKRSASESKNNTYDRLEAREKVKLAQMKHLKRSYDD